LNFVEVRDFLYSRMRGAKQHDVPHGGASPSLAGVLGEVAAELRALRQALEQQSAGRGDR
jgi:hypothetical protein